MHRNYPKFCVLADGQMIKANYIYGLIIIKSILPTIAIFSIRKTRPYHRHSFFYHFSWLTVITLN